MPSTFHIRPYRPGDEPVCVAIYQDAIRNGTAPQYSAREAEAWAPGGMDAKDWAPRLAAGTTWIAETRAGACGFITLDSHGHLDLFFVRPEARPLGVAAALYDSLIASAGDAGHKTLTTHASLLARSFLSRRGWVVVGEERVMRHGVELTRYPMRLDRVPGR